jgi:hypothetical protein
MKAVIEMAKEAGLLTWLKPPEDVIERFKAFEALIRADEREACAKVCDDEWGTGAEKDAGIVFAKAIRARGET